LQPHQSLCCALLSSRPILYSTTVLCPSGITSIFFLIPVLPALTTETVIVGALKSVKRSVQCVQAVDNEFATQWRASQRPGPVDHSAQPARPVSFMARVPRSAQSSPVRPVRRHTIAATGPVGGRHTGRRPPGSTTLRDDTTTTRTKRPDSQT